MRILVNTRLLIKNKLDGIGWFSFETLKRITRNHPNDQFYFVFDRAFSNEFVFSPNIEPIVLGPPARHPLLWYFWFEHRIPEIVKRIKPDLFVSPDGYLPLRTNVKSLAVIHDINFLHYPNDLPWISRWYYNYYFQRFARKASRLATVSEYSKKDIIENYHINSNKIDVVYNGYNQAYHPIVEGEKAKVKQKYSNGEDFFVFVGSLHPRKNVANMLKAFDQFRKKHTKRQKLIIIGERFFKTGDINNTLGSMQFSDDVIFIGRLDPNRIRDVLASATALILVSKFEGFGIPVIEALACDTPVIVSNVTSLPEVASNAGLYANPFSVDSISNAMLQMVNQNGLRSQLVQNGRKVHQKYSWDATAKLFWDSIIKTVETKQ